jgi:RecA/RadA recombinase
MARKKAEGGEPVRRRKPRKARSRKPPVIDEAMIDDAFMAACDRTASKGGWKNHSIVGSDARKLLVGLPVPSLAIEMLIMCACWPLGRIFQLVGEEGCGKSTLLWEITRWIFLHGGFAHVMENENKDNAAVRDAILQYNMTWISRRLRIEFTGSMNDWMTRLRRNMDAVWVDNMGLETDSKETMARRFRWRTPYGYFIDSFMSTSTEKRQEKIDKAGAPTQDFAREAIMIADDARTWTRRMRGTSIILGGTNHMKPGQDRHGNRLAKAPGGKAIKFMEALEIHMDRFPSALDGVDRGGYTVSLFTQKNSFAPDKRRINVNVVWQKEETDDPKHPRKRMYWDWHTATAEALVKFMAESAAHRKAIVSVCDINLVKGHKLWSETLGFPEDEPVDYHTFGRAIDYNKEIRQLLRAVIGIEPMNHFRPYTPLEEIYETASPVHDDHLDTIYNDDVDCDLSGFADVAAALAGQVRKDRERVNRQRQEEQEMNHDDEDDLDAIGRLVD